jgi:hypothetical protein
MQAVIITQIIQLHWVEVVRVFPAVLSSNLGANKSYMDSSTKENTDSQ